MEAAKKVIFFKAWPFRGGGIAKIRFRLFSGGGIRPLFFNFCSASLRIRKHVI